MNKQYGRCAEECRGTDQIDGIYCCKYTSLDNMQWQAATTLNPDCDGPSYPICLAANNGKNIESIIKGLSDSVLLIRSHHT